ncbi:MAG TPA: tRNA lysidine(34) synthetase TilS [Candidatus Acidoferrales bacterium]|nr:tRNA lysidine(34) synthetase TilS [Candidatus Acidoferrales bacterium]
MLRDFFNRFENYIRKHQLVSENDKIIVSVSGGIDSTVLLDLMMELKNRMQMQIAVAHINHKLRGSESEEDEKFVKDLAESSGIECFVHGVDTRAFIIEHKTSLQAGAREIRYKFLETVMILKNFTRIATAHNANDNAETMLFNLLRGSGANGLGGIPVKRGHIIRPLLFAERKEIEQYARLKSLKYREDSSNIKNYYMRNVIRHSTIPQIQEKINPAVIATLNRTAEIFQEMNSFISNEVKLLYSSVAKNFEGEKLVLDIFKLKNTLLFIRENMIMAALKEFVRGEVDYNKVHAVMDLINSETGSSIELGSDVVVFRDRYNLVFIKNPKEPADFVAEIIPGKKYEFEEFYLNTEVVEKGEVNFSLSPVVEFVDADNAGDALTLRSWHPGDSFTPLGMKGHKKISDFLVDQKIPIYQKNNVLVLSGKDGIIWVCGLRVDDRFKITEKTRRVLKLEFGYK